MHINAHLIKSTVTVLISDLSISVSIFIIPELWWLIKVTKLHEINTCNFSADDSCRNANTDSISRQCTCGTLLSKVIKWHHTASRGHFDIKDCCTMICINLKNDISTIKPNINHCMFLFAVWCHNRDGISGVRLWVHLRSSH